ncbi:hypothetical protein L9F63_026828, partial [Diploptera punctata]
VVVYADTVVLMCLQYGRAPIHWASSRGNTDIMEMLIAAKCDIEAKDKYVLRLLRCCRL